MELLIKSKYEARDLLAQDMGKKIKRVISFDNPGGSPPSNWKNVEKLLRLEFHDVVKANPNKFVFPEKEHLKKIVKFCNEIKEEKYSDTVLIHCQAGISRSTAAAFTFNCIMMGEGKEAEALKDVFERRPKARPNKLMVQYADAVLRRGGAMIAVLKKNPLLQR